MTASANRAHPVEITDTNATVGTILRIYNTANGETETLKFEASNKTNIDLANLTTQVSNGDKIIFSVHGKNEGSKTYTVSGGFGKVTISSNASAAPGVTI